MDVADIFMRHGKMQMQNFQLALILRHYIGNTNIVMGVMNGMELVSSFRLTTQTPRTSDEYGIMIVDLLRQRGVEAKDITAVIISSVVPDIMYSFSNGLKRYLRQKPMIVGPGLKTGIAVRTDNPREVGADRIVNCVAAYELYLSFYLLTSLDFFALM